MRNFINLFETKIADDDLLALIPDKLTIPVSDLHDALNLMMKGHALDGVRRIQPRDLEWAMEDLRDAIATVAREFDSGKIRIYRSITVNEIDLSEPTHVGLHWTHNENFTMGALDDGQHITMEGSVTCDAIDWSETLPLAYDGVEDEIRLIPGATITNFSADVEEPVASVQYA